MIRKRRRPDFIFVLAVIVGLGVILTMKVQASSGHNAPTLSVSAKPALVQSALK